MRSLSAPTTGDISPVTSMNSAPDQAKSVRPRPKCSASGTKYIWYAPLIVVDRNITTKPSVTRRWMR